MPSINQSQQLALVALVFICGLIILRFFQSSQKLSSSSPAPGPSAESFETKPAEHANLRDSSSNDMNKLPSNTAPNVQVYKEVCKQPLLLGNAHHGGWKICSDPSTISFNINGNCIVYSFGLGADWSFDKAAEERGCEVHGFDPSGLLWRQGMHGRDYSGIDYAKQYPSLKRHFHNWGLGAVSRAIYPIGTIPQDWPGLGDPALSKSNSEPWETRSLVQTFVDLNHLEPSNTVTASSSSGAIIDYKDSFAMSSFKSFKNIAVLKIDCEGAEWDALIAAFYNDAFVRVLEKGMVKQLLIEWHWDPDSRAKNDRHSQLMQRVEAVGFKPWNIERHVGSDCCLDMSYVWVGKPEVWNSV